MERDVLWAFPEQPIGRMAFVSNLPVRWNRGAVDHAIRRLVNDGLLVRVSRGQYALTDAGREVRAVGQLVQKAG